jgi:transcription antitermination factor NusA-like protein
VQQLFEREVPEIADGIVQLKAVAREAGQRTKIAVAAANPDVDPVGACVGPRGNRVGKVVAELGNEKVDIVRWNADPITFISNALSPAQILKVILTDDKGKDGEAEGTATVVVAEDQQSLAIGKQGQNVRLAAKLTHWRIDIRTEKQLAEEQAKKMFDLDRGAASSTPTIVSESKDEHSELFSLDALDELNEVAPDQDAGSTFDIAELADESTVDSDAEIATGDAPAGDVAAGNEQPESASAEQDSGIDEAPGGAGVEVTAGVGEERTELTPDEVAEKFVEQVSGATPTAEDEAASEDANGVESDTAEGAAGESGNAGEDTETRADI